MVHSLCDARAACMLRVVHARITTDCALLHESHPALPTDARDLLLTHRC